MNNKDEQDKFFELVARAFNVMSAPINERLAETDARLTVNRFLIEIIYANHFLDNAAGFDQLMDEALTKLRGKPVLSGPMPVEDVIEHQARAAAHVERFRNAVKQRLAQG